MCSIYTFNQFVRISSVKHLHSFTTEGKLKVVCEAEEIGNFAAGHKYDILESCIRAWKKEERGA